MLHICNKLKLSLFSTYIFFLYSNNLLLSILCDVIKIIKMIYAKKKIISHFPNILEMFKRMNFCKNRSQSVCYISNDTNYSMNFFSFCVIILIFKSFYGVCLVYIILTLFCCRECYSHP